MYGIKVLLKKGTTVNAALLKAFEDLYKKTMPYDEAAHDFTEVFCRGSCFKVEKDCYLVATPVLYMPEIGPITNERPYCEEAKLINWCFGCLDMGEL